MIFGDYDVILFKQFLEEKKGLAPSSVYTYIKSLEKFLVTDPNLYELEDYNTFLIEMTVKKRCGHFYSVIKAFIEYKITDATTRTKLVTGLIRPKERYDTVRERVHLDQDKILDLINYLDNHKHRIIALIQMLTGVRAGDVLRMKSDTIVPETYKDMPVLRLNIVGKGRKRNTVFIHDEVSQKIIMEYIINRNSIDGYYFLEQGKYKNRRGNVHDENSMVKMNYLWFWEDLKQALHTAGINKELFATHDFRRCFARRAWEMKSDIHRLQSLLNHSNPATTLRYLEQSGLKNIDYHREMQN